MIWLYALGVAAAVSAGVYLVLSRDLLRSIVGVSIIASAANLVVFAAGKPSQPHPPIIADGLELVAQTATPLSQALVLTAIVIGFSLTCLSLFIVLAVNQKTRLNDSDALTASEPSVGDNDQPRPDDDDDDADGQPRIEAHL
jgi:multicomponent Na+:H+ antiporter subunit C